jgi:hypothetical protein
MTTVATFDQVLAQIWAGLGLGQPMFFLKDFFSLHAILNCFCCIFV